jgi:hypothetical protein
MECVHADDRQNVIDAIGACALTGEPMRVGYRLTRSVDGEQCVFDARGQRLSEDGRAARLVGAVTDVTDVTRRVLAEAEERTANAFQQAVIQASRTSSTCVTCPR